MLIVHAERPACTIPVVVCFLNPRKWRRNRGDGDACGLRPRGRVMRDAGNRTAVEWNGRAGPQLRPRERSRALLSVLGAQRRKTIVCILRSSSLVCVGFGGTVLGRFKSRRSRPSVGSRSQPCRAWQGRSTASQQFVERVQCS